MAYLYTKRAENDLCGSFFETLGSLWMLYTRGFGPLHKNSSFVTHIWCGPYMRQIYLSSVCPCAVAGSTTIPCSTVPKTCHYLFLYVQARAENFQSSANTVCNIRGLAAANNSTVSAGIANGKWQLTSYQRLSVVGEFGVGTFGSLIEGVKTTFFLKRENKTS